VSEQKTPEQIAAEQKLEAQRKEAEAKAAAEKLAAKKTAAGEVHFVHEDRVFVPIVPKVFIPGIGYRTALEICADEKSQAYLINEGCIGSVISEVE